MNLSAPLPAQYPLLTNAQAVHEQFGNYFFPKPLNRIATALSRKMEEGHICIHRADALTAVWEADPTADEQVWSHFIDHPWVGDPQHQEKPFIVDENRIYTQRYFQYETRILERLQQFFGSSQARAPQQWDRLLAHRELIQALFPTEESQEPNWQQIAVIMAYVQEFFVLTGGPGTGKTTTVAKLLALLWSIQPDMQIALAAPTGKAAARMAESLRQTKLDLSATVQENMNRLEPSTIHRLLGYIPNSIHFKHHREHPLPYQCVIIDESSMMDVALMSKLLDAIDTHTKLILLGDKNQLASVEAGSVFSDLCNAQLRLNVVPKIWLPHWKKLGIYNLDFSNPSTNSSSHPLDGHMIELQKSHRFKRDAGIGKLANIVIQGEVDACQNFMQQTHADMQFSDNNHYLSAIKQVIDAYSQYINEPDTQKAIQLFQRQRVLCAVREGPYGVDAINMHIENQLQLKKQLQKKEVFYENRPVMVTGNCYDLELFNGDIGLVRKDAHGQLRVWFETKSGELKHVSPAYLDGVDTAFAMTVHKSQGSEFDEVTVVLPPQEDLPILTRELLYTAITRAKKSVHLIGNQASILAGVERKVERGSGIQERLSF
jgi:exodeoxyribonuclease V alpha subunit